MRLAAAAVSMLVAGAAAGAPAVVHGLWHTRLMYHIHRASQGFVTTDTLTFLTAEQPADCGPAHWQVDCRSTGEVSSSGHVYASGQAGAPAGPGGSVKETYQKSAHWDSPPGDPAGASSPGLPAPSKVGAGLSVSLSLGGVLSGVAQQVASGPDGTFTQNYMSLAQPLQASLREDGRDPFTLTLSFDPSAGVASDPEAPRLATDLRALLNRPPGEYGLAVAGGALLGAATEYRAAGLPSVCYTRSRSSQDSSGITIEGSYCGWLTAPGDRWAPKSLPPQDRAPPAK